MINVVEHIDEIEEKLTRCDNITKGKFGAWCNWFLFNQKNINAFIEKNLSLQAITDIEKSIIASWNNDHDEDIKSLIEKIEALEWDEDLSEEDGEQGVLELLGGVSSMLTGWLNNNAMYGANCGERVLNYIDYENSPPMETKESYELKMQQEIDKQIKFIKLAMEDNSSLQIDSLR